MVDGKRSAKRAFLSRLFTTRTQPIQRFYDNSIGSSVDIRLGRKETENQRLAHGKMSSMIGIYDPGIRNPVRIDGWFIEEFEIPCVC